MNAYKADHVYLSIKPSIRIIQLKNCWTDLMKFGMDIMTLEVNLNLYFLIS